MWSLRKKRIPGGIDTNNRKEVFELTIFHPQEPSMLNIFSQRIFDTNNLFRSSSSQKPGLPTTYLHQAAAVPTIFCIKQLLQHKFSTTNSFAWELRGVHGSLGHVNIYSDAAGKNIIADEGGSVVRHPCFQRCINSAQSVATESISVNVVQCSMVSCTPWAPLPQPKPTSNNTRFTSTRFM